jgi:hypothetical protein
MAHRPYVPPVLGAFALITLAVLLPTIGLLLYVLFAGFFHAR